MAPWWLYGGYVFPVVVRPENLTFYDKFDLEGQSQLAPETIGILTKLFCTSGPNLVILTWMGNELWCGQAQNGVNFDFKVKFDLEDQGQLPPKKNRNLNQGLLHLWSKFNDPSLNGSRVIVPTSKWLIHTHTDTQTDAGNDNTQRPNWPPVKNTT